MSDYLLYWKPDTVDDNLVYGGRLDHAASHQLGRVSPGDTLWIVTARSGSLRIVGRLRVALVTDHEQASRILDTDDLWEADYHVIAQTGTAESMTEIPIDSIAALLRFESKSGRNQLAITDGRISASQLQTMRKLTQASAQLLRHLWEAGDRVQDDVLLPEEVEEDQAIYEGAARQIAVSTYERSPEARQICIAYYGAICYVCGFDFGKAYGEAGRGLIHVHHLQQLAEAGGEHTVDPVRDLRPVCPNCHAVIHRRRPPYGIEEVKGFLRRD